MCHSICPIGFTYLEASETLPVGSHQVQSAPVVAGLVFENVLQGSVQKRVELHYVRPVQRGPLQCGQDGLPDVIAEIIYILQIINEVTRLLVPSPLVPRWQINQRGERASVCLLETSATRAASANCTETDRASCSKAPLQCLALHQCTAIVLGL